MQLIEQSELEITEISLSQVTAQYLDHIAQLQNLNPSELNQFIELAAKLIHIKSQALLPTLQSPEYDEDLQDLTRQLEEYRHYQKASSYLERLIKSGGASWSREANKPTINPASLAMPSVTADQLQEAFSAAIARIPQLPEQAVDPGYTIEEAANHLRAVISSSAETKLQDIFAALDSRAKAVVIFLCLLELWKAGEIVVRQDQAFGDIILIDG